jgi:RNA polymerase sigma-70 factor (ECF subfamily)
VALNTANADSDSAIIASLKQRDPAAVADLYDRYGRLVYSLAFHILGNAGDAEDVAQEVFLRVWTRAHLIDSSRGLFAPWLLTVARNLAIDQFRSTRGRDRLIPQGPGDCYDFVPGLIPFRSPDSTDVLRAFSTLPPNQRQVIEFPYFEGMSQREASERVGTAKTWVRTALRILSEGMGTQSSQDSAREPFGAGTAPTGHAVASLADAEAGPGSDRGDRPNMLGDASISKGI